MATYSEISPNGLLLRTRSKSKKMFKPTRAMHNIAELAGDLPDEGTVYRMLSVEGGFCSLSIILWVADHARINELTVSTLCVGKKHMKIFDALYKNGKIGTARFIMARMMEQVKGRRDDTVMIKDIAARNGWTIRTLNNHSKVILMNTGAGKYVVETSSNLNENPKIEQYIMEKSDEVYDFYYSFFGGDGP